MRNRIKFWKIEYKDQGLKFDQKMAHIMDYIPIEEWTQPTWSNILDDIRVGSTRYCRTCSRMFSVMSVRTYCRDCDPLIARVWE